MNKDNLILEREKFEAEKQLMSALVVLPPRESAGGKIGKAFGDGFAKGMEEARKIEQARKLREQLQLEQKIADEMHHYNSVISQLSFESAHQTISLPPELNNPFTDIGFLLMNDNRKLGYVFKFKLNRVLSDGILVEWLWSLDISNETAKSFFSSGSIEYPKAKFKIELLDSNDFAISSCNYYADLFLKKGERSMLQGKWIIPFDQVKNLSNYQIKIGQN